MYTEIPAGTFVAGPDGIYDVERANGKVRPATMLTIMMARS